MEQSLKRRAQRCAVKICMKKRTKKNEFFRVPKDAIRAQLWYEKLGLKGNPRKILYVCEDHFEWNCFKFYSGRTWLTRTAVPSLNIKQRKRRQKEITPPNIETMIIETHIKSDDIKRNEETKEDRLELFKQNLKRMKPDVKFNKDTNKELLQLWKLSHKYLNKNILGLIDLQLHLKESYIKTQLTSEYKTFALHLYYASPLSYEHLQNILKLPTVKNLKNTFYPRHLDIDEELMSNLKIKVDMMTDEQKYCAVCVDIIDLKPNLYYAINRDKIIGFHEVAGNQRRVIAEKGILVMAQGVLSDWEQPIGMVLISEALGVNLKQWIENVMKKLIDINLNILSLVCDMNMAIVYKLMMKISEPYIDINDKRIYFIFDVPNLLTDLRNTLVEKNFQLPNNKTVKWFHILWCHNYEGNRNYSLLPNIKDEHLKNKIHKKDYQYAVQIFRPTTAAAISNLVDFNSLSSEALVTCDFICKISNLFDLLTSNTIQSKNPFKNALTLDEKQTLFLKEMLTLFQNLHVVNKHGEFSSTMFAPFVQGFVTTINNLINLKSELNPKYKYLLTRRFSLNSLRIFLNEARSTCKSEKVTAKEIVFKFKDYLASKLMTSPVDSTAKDDLNDILTHIQEIKDIEKYEKACIKSDYNYFDHLYQEHEVTRDVYKTFKTSVNRNLSDDIRGIATFILEQSYKDHVCVEDKRKLKHEAHDDFAKYMSALNQIFLKYFYKNTTPKHFLKGLLRELAVPLNIQVPSVCECFPYFYAKLLFARIRIREELRFINYKLKTGRKMPKFVAINNVI